MKKQKTGGTAPKKRAAAFKISVEIERRGEAPLTPSAAAVEALFVRAWDLVPVARRPDVSGHKKIAADVHIVDDAEIAELNLAHMKHAGPTDVLSFPMGDFDPERDAFNLGEIVASFETAQREAEARGLSFDEELSRYCVHGFLHLLGYEDDTAALRKGMFAVQEKAVLGE